MSKNKLENVTDQLINMNYRGRRLLFDKYSPLGETAYYLDFFLFEPFDIFEINKVVMGTCPLLVQTDKFQYLHNRIHARQR